jgi:hypothetical protein
MKLLEEIILVFLVKKNSLYWIFQQGAIELEIMVLYPRNDCQMLGPLVEFLGVFGYLIENKYKLEHFKSINV